MGDKLLEMAKATTTEGKRAEAKDGATKGQKKGKGGKGAKGGGGGEGGEGGPASPSKGNLLQVHALLLSP